MGADKAAVTEDLWQQFADGLRSFISARVSSPDAVDDILQDVFVKIHRRSDTLRDSTRLTSWVFKITRNAIVDYYRSAPRRREVVVDDVGTETPATWDGVGPQTTDAARQEIAGCVQPLLEQLPSVYREALELVEMDGLTQAEAARRAGLSLSGMKSRVQRGRAHLHRTLTNWCDIQIDARGGPLSCVPSQDTACGDPADGDGAVQGCS